MLRYVLPLLGILGLPAMADVDHGRYVVTGTSCASLNEATFTFGQGWMGRHEEVCEILRTVDVDDMDAVLYNVDCTAAGEFTGAKRIFMGRIGSVDHPEISVMISEPGGRDPAFHETYRLCRK